MVTVEEAKLWAARNRDELDRRRLSSKDETVQMMNRMNDQLSRSLWDAGSFVGEQLQELGATEEEVQDAQFAVGQRAFLGDPWGAAVEQVNGYIKDKSLTHKPGPELAEEVFQEWIK